MNFFPPVITIVFHTLPSKVHNTSYVIFVKNRTIYTAGKMFIIMPRCDKCKGCGLVRFTFKCGHCQCNACYLCENISKVLQECPKCHWHWQK